MRTRIHEFCKKESFRSSWSFLFTTGKKSQDESFAYPHLARFVDNLDAASKRATIWYYIQLIRIRTNIILTIRIRNYN